MFPPWVLNSSVCFYRDFLYCTFNVFPKLFIVFTLCFTYFYKSNKILWCALSSESPIFLLTVASFLKIPTVHRVMLSNFIYQHLRLFSWFQKRKSQTKKCPGSSEFYHKMIPNNISNIPIYGNYTRLTRSFVMIVIFSNFWNDCSLKHVAIFLRGGSAGWSM